MLKIKDNELTFYCLPYSDPHILYIYLYYLICLQVLAPYLPRSDPQLSPTIYELVLNDFLNTDAEVRLTITAFPALTYCLVYIRENGFSIVLCLVL